MTKTSTWRAAGALALAAAFVVPAASPAFADGRWEHHGDWRGGHDRGRDWHEGRDRHGDHGGGGAFLGGALLGLGIGAAVGASQRPYYAPPPPVYYGD